MLLLAFPYVVLYINCMGIIASNAALLIIDVQQDFCSGGSLAVPEGEQIIPVINSISSRFKKVIATQDWHPPGHVSFASVHPGKRPFDDIHLPADGPSAVQTLWPDHCVAGSPGAGFHPDLDLTSVDLILRKGSGQNLDSYSAFFENDRKTATGLVHYLAGLGISEVVLTGLAADVCVYYSAVDAVNLGLSTSVVMDGVKGIDTPRGTLNHRLEEMKHMGVVILASGELTG